MARLRAFMVAIQPARPLPPLRIGVFDSGLGGVSVLRALQRELPGAELIYAADSGHAPYGERDPQHVLARSEALAGHLRREGAELLVMACNTATAVAAAALRAAHPDWPIVGVEPGLKPALAISPSGRIGVMATQATLASPKFRRLLDELLAGAAPGTAIHLQACPGLAAAIEAGEADSPAVRAAVAEHTAPLRAQRVDTVVLGCTHYPFAAGLIAEALGPGVRLIDTAEAVARQARRLAEAQHAARLDAAGPSKLALWSSGEADTLARFVAQRLERPLLPVRRLPV